MRTEMKYTYECFNSIGVRQHIGVRAAAVPKVDFEGGDYIVVSDNFGNGPAIYIGTRDEWERFLDDAAMSQQRASHDPFLEEDDGFRVKTSAEMTLGELTGKVNAKNAAGAKKAPTRAVPPIAILAMGLAMEDGAKKYGAFNWRDSEVTASVFFNAMMRHLLQWYAGERCADDSAVHHLGHLMAGAAILLDAEFTGVLVDDRSKYALPQDIIGFLTNAT